MKKTIRLVTALALTVSLMVTGLFAANFGNLADELKGLNLFQGTEAGYELDRAPTRAEAGVMLVRLLGKEDQAKTDYAKGAIANPFTDVPDWAAPYVAYLYKNSLANGTTETTYSPDDLCSAQMYCTFALRTLGYSDKAGGDFTYQDALAYAKQVGITDDLLLSGNFTRDQLAAVSYNTLGTSVKGGKALLLESLVDSGAVSKTAAAPILEKLNNLKKYEQAAAAWKDIKSIDMSANMTFVFKDGSGMEMKMTMPMVFKYICNGTDIQMEMKANMKAFNEEVLNMQMWIKDGWLYMQNGTEKTKVSLADFGLDEGTLIQLSQMQQSKYAIKIAPYMFKDITIEQKGDDTVYTFKDGGLFSWLMNMYSDSTENGLNESYDIEGPSYSITVDKEGALKQITVSLGIKGLTFDSGETLTGESMDMDITMVCTINAIGDSVKITFPDFSGFVESPASPAI